MDTDVRDYNASEDYNSSSCGTTSSCSYYLTQHSLICDGSDGSAYDFAGELGCSPVFTDPAIGYYSPASATSSVAYSSTGLSSSGGGCYGAFSTSGTNTISGTITLSNEYTTAQLTTNTTAALPSWDDDWDDTAGSFRNLTTNELTLSIRESKYRFRFKVPKVGSGKCYKLDWVERFIPALTYDSLGAVNGGGTSITSFTVVNGGSGYTSGATVTISAPGNGGTTATGTVVVDTSPSSPTFGQITAVNVSNAGSRYTSAPSFSISGTGTGAVIHIHLGTETPKTWTWDGTPPGGYDPADSATWPLSPEYTIPVPEANGTTTVANLKTACTGCT